MNSLFEAARWAPSAKNRQPWRYYRCSSSLKLELFNLLKSNELYGSAQALETSCELLLVFHRNESKEQRKHMIPDLLSIGASVENLIVAANGFQISSLWICDILDIKAKSPTLRSLQKRFGRLICGICLGYSMEDEKKPLPTFDEQLKLRSRFPLKEIIVQDT